MPRQLQDGDWDAAFLAEPYITAAGEQFGDQVLADVDQGAVINHPRRSDGQRLTLAPSGDSPSSMLTSGW